MVKKLKVIGNVEGHGEKSHLVRAEAPNPNQSLFRTSKTQLQPIFPVYIGL